MLHSVCQNNPDAYQDVTSVTAEAGDVLVGKVYVTSGGVVTTGTMANNTPTTEILSATSITYTIPKGYHSGTGTVKIVLEEKSVTPTKSTQNIIPTNGKVLSKVVVNPIPDNYIDTTDADAVATEILDGKFAYIDGVIVEGTMANNGAVSKTLDATSGNQSYTVPTGYHNGSGKVSITLETKTATPTKSAQNITPTSGKVLSKVTVNAIPTAYQDVTGVTAVATDVLSGKKIVNSSGTVVTGTMANNGSTGGTIDGLTTTSVSIPSGYTTGGTVSLTSDIEDSLASI